MNFRVWLYLVLAVGSLSLSGCGRDPSPNLPNTAASAAVDAAEAPTELARATTAKADDRQPTAVATTAKPNISAPRAELTPAEIDEGWISLFDGATLFGWQAHSKANWAVTDGAITVSDGEPGLLCTTVQFSDFDMLAEFRAGPTTNSGIFLRTAAVSGPDDVATKSYELNIAPADNPFPTGSLVRREKANLPSAYTTTAACDDAWHTFAIRVNGAQVTIQLDDAEVLSYTDPAPVGRGYIGLQLNSGPIAFRNLKLRPLNLQPLLAGEELTDWKPVAESKDFSAKLDGGVLHVHGGKGALESKQQYGDFVVQLQCRTEADNLNSGLFFRSIPGEMMNGYESQIHNGYQHGDRTKPIDHGTGAIFRRVQARRVVANDKEWFSKTIIADGANVAVWVNGEQVTAWTDTRKADNNPRNGLRLAAGTLQIQGHDPTTELSFRKIQAVELRPRD